MRIIFGILGCFLVPAIVKILVLRPVFGLLNLDEQISKGIQGVIIIGIILGTYKLFYKKFEHREISELAGRYFFRDSATGFGIGFALISIVTGIFYIMGYYSPITVHPVTALFKPVIIFSVMGVWEEIIFRGIIYRITEDSLGTIRALLVSSLIFGFVHFSNSGFNWLSGMAIALELGLLTGIVYTLTGRLWMPIALHIGWNFNFVVFGTTVSGAKEFPSFIQSRLTGPELITGGEFGPENSLITILISVVLFAVLFHTASRKGKLQIPPKGK
ncbi:MAG: CPBP family intramembrane metalloprotease [Calditrichaeota bacterium]|nr:CPBP family intramembrane metalloprotease [Calditrichota bacterium]